MAGQHDSLLTMYSDLLSSSEDGWLSWVLETDDEEDESGDVIRDNICSRSIQEKMGRVLIEVVSSPCFMKFALFWAAKEVRGRSILTTSRKLSVPSITLFDPCKGMSLFRNKCVEHLYIVDDGAEVEQLGPPGRVFRNGQPESSPDLRLYSAREFPLRDHAAICGLKSYLALPVFDLHHNQCIGVLELFSYDDGGDVSLDRIPYICNKLKVEELRTTSIIDKQQRINLWESVTDDHERQVNDKGKMLDLNLNEYDQRHSISGSRANLQKPETDHTENVEEQEQKMIDRNSNEGNESKTSFQISYKDLELHFGKTLEEAANELGVSRSTLKRVRKACGIKRWPSNVKNKKNPCLFLEKTSNQQISKRSSSNISISNFLTCTESTGEVDKTCQETYMVTIKVKFKEDIIKFDMCLSSGLEKLMGEVAKRLSLKIGNFKLKYKDDDNDLILLTCDEDWQYYVKRTRSLSKTTSVQVLVHLVSN